jgi:hypothetical protein
MVRTSARSSTGLLQNPVRSVSASPAHQQVPIVVKHCKVNHDLQQHSSPFRVLSACQTQQPMNGQGDEALRCTSCMCLQPQPMCLQTMHIEPPVGLELPRNIITTMADVQGEHLALIAEQQHLTSSVTISSCRASAALSRILPSWLLLLLLPPPERHLSPSSTC